MITFGVIVLASFFASFTDWLFMDVIVHPFYAANPQTWRSGQGSMRIVLSQIIGTVASGAVIGLCLLAPGRPLLVAGAAWCAGPFPVIVQNLQWIRMHPAVAASYGVGWLARLVIAVAVAGWLLVR